MGEEGKSEAGLSSSKREDLWALIIATLVALAAFGAPEGIHHFFKSTLFLF